MRQVTSLRALVFSDIKRGPIRCQVLSTFEDSRFPKNKGQLMNSYQNERWSSALRIGKRGRPSGKGWDTLGMGRV